MSRRLNGFVLTYALRWIIFGVLMLGIVVFVLSNITCGCEPAPKKVVARARLHTFAVAIEMYHTDFGAYPPDDFHGGNGSEIMRHFLGKKLCAGSTTFGPYLEFTESQLRDIPGSPNKKIVSPFGGDYYYCVRVDSKGQPNGYLLVDPGKDQELGGRLDREKGFIVDDPQKAADNLIAPEKRDL